MINLPQECYVNKFIPKKIFYEKVGVSSGVKEEFVNLVERITWLYKLSYDTIGIPKTDSVEEIQIFQIDVKDKKIPLSVIKTITKGVQYKILFLIKYNEDYRYLIKLDDIYTSDWNEEIDFQLNGIDLENVWNNMVKGIIKETDNDLSIGEILESKNKIDELKNKINKLKSQADREKQFNRQIELDHEIKRLNKELEELLNE